MKEYNFVNVNDLNQWEQQTSLKVRSFDNLKQKRIVPINHRETVEGIIEQNLDIIAEKYTVLGKANTIKMSIATDSHASIKLKPYRTLFVKLLIVDKAVNDMLAANFIHPSRSHWIFPRVVVDKKDATKRFCTDLGKLNNISKKSSWDHGRPDKVKVMRQMLPLHGHER